MHSCRFRWALLGVVAFLLLASPSRAGGVRIVEPTGTQNFATIQAAVDAAPEGSVLLVGEGSYAGFQLSGKSLAIFAVPGAAVMLTSRVTVAGIQVGQVVTLSGLHVAVSSTSVALDVSNSPGMVRLQDCQFLAYDWDFTWCPSPPNEGYAGASVTNCDRVLFSACTFHTGDTRGTSSALQDVLVGTWTDGRATVTFHADADLFDADAPRFDDDPNTPLFAAGGADAGALGWARESQCLISIKRLNTGPETVQAEVSGDHLILTWRTESILTHEFTGLDTAASP